MIGGFRFCSHNIALDQPSPRFGHTNTGKQTVYACQQCLMIVKGVEAVQRKAEDIKTSRWCINQSTSALASNHHKIQQQTSKDADFPHIVEYPLNLITSGVSPYSVRIKALKKKGSVVATFASGWEGGLYAPAFAALQQSEVISVQMTFRAWNTWSAPRTLLVSRCCHGITASVTAYNQPPRKMCGN